MSILKAERVSKHFGKLAAVNDVSFEVEKGEVFGIAGPNGAGKSTLFNLIGGMFTYTGKIYFDGDNITGLRPYEICHKGIARTFQIPTLFSTLSVFENVRVGAHFGVRKQDRGEAEKGLINEVIAFTGLGGKENALAGALNLFDKKLTMLAAALATKPKLLMVDEPMSGLSPPEIKRFIELLKRINSELGVTIIMIEHIMKVLIKVCQRLMILNDGEIISIGEPLQVSKDKKVVEVYVGTGMAG